MLFGIYLPSKILPIYIIFCIKHLIFWDIFDDKHDILEQKIEEWVNIGKDYPIIYHKFKRYLEKLNNDIVLKKIKDEMKFILYNNRNVIKNKALLTNN